MSQPKKRLTQTERTARSDAAMFTAAIELIAAEGVEGATLKDIGEKAGFSRGLAAYRFGTKDKLLQDVFRKIQSNWSQLVSDATTGKRGLDAFHASVCAWEQFMFQDGNEFKTFALLRFGRLVSDQDAKSGLRIALFFQLETVTAWLQEAIEDGDLKPDTDPTLLATRHLAMTFGTSYLYLLTPETIDRNTLFDEHVDSLLARYLTAPTD